MTRVLTNQLRIINSTWMKGRGLHKKKYGGLYTVLKVEYSSTGVASRASTALGSAGKLQIRHALLNIHAAHTASRHRNVK